MRTDDVLVLLGVDHRTFGHVHTDETAAGRSAAAISPGARAGAPSMANKADRRFPNEDALAVVEDDDRTLLAVADAHFGHGSSHALIRGLVAEPGAIPSDAETLRAHVTSSPAEHATAPSRTTFTVCAVDRGAGRGFGFTWGDSSVVTVHDDRVLRHTMPLGNFVDTRDVATRAPRPFTFGLHGVRLVVAFTDGVDECNYRSPSTSIGPPHILDVARAADFDPSRFVRDLARLALRGVDGNPGGEDNLAIAATTP